MLSGSNFWSMRSRMFSSCGILSRAPRLARVSNELSIGPYFRKATALKHPLGSNVTDAHGSAKRDLTPFSLNCFTGSREQPVAEAQPAVLRRKIYADFI